MTDDVSFKSFSVFTGLNALQVPGQGDCFFATILYALTGEVYKNSEPTTYAKHIRQLRVYLAARMAELRFQIPLQLWSAISNIEIFCRSGIFSPTIFLDKMSNKEKEDLPVYAEDVCIHVRSSV
jgi:hypothetical protein